MNFNHFDGIQLGYTADTMSSIMEDLDLSIAQVSPRYHFKKKSPLVSMKVFYMRITILRRL